MAKTVYILREMQFSNGTDSTVVYGSKERAIKAFTEMVNSRITHDYFQEQEFDEAEKDLKANNEWYNAHTTTVQDYEHRWKNDVWKVRLLKESAAAIEFEEEKKHNGLRHIYFTYRDNSWDEYDTVVSAELEEVELQ